MENMTQAPKTVSQLIHEIKDLLEGHYLSVKVVGEISNFSRSSSQHFYFSLNDSTAQLAACVFKFSAAKNPIVFTLKEGDKVECVGNISVYPQRGTFQLIISQIKKSGEGDLKQQFEALKTKLFQEGLFSLETKKNIPPRPIKIGVITALQGAALQDFLKVFKLKAFGYSLLISPSLVQGPSAPKSLMMALEKILEYHRKKHPLDVLIFTRGGGSLEDLWAFNDEVLIRKIKESPIPTISAIGHEVDVTLCDYVCDYRVSTPTAAAEFLCSWQIQVSSILEQLKMRMTQSLLLKQKNIEMMNMAFRPERLENIWNKKFQNYLFRLQNTKMLLKRSPLLISIQRQQTFLEKIPQRGQSSLKSLWKLLEQKIKNLEGLLQVISPKNVLKRGYCLAYSLEYVENNQEQKKLLTSVKQCQENAKITLEFWDGERRL